jgi:hypothetical protein
MLLEVKLKENQKTEEQWNLKECCWWPNWRRKEGEKGDKSSSRIR